MGSSFVVFFDPFFGEGSDFTDIGEQVGVKDGFTVHAVESFDVTVLHGPAGLNKLNLNFMFLAPPLKTLEVNSGPLSVRITVGLPRQAITLSRVLIMRLEDSEVSISMANYLLVVRPSLLLRKSPSKAGYHRQVGVHPFEARVLLF